MDWESYMVCEALRDLFWREGEKKCTPVARLLREEVSGDVMGLAPLLELVGLDLGKTRVR
eukprot:1174479-Amphidinium_carterae.1